MLDLVNWLQKNGENLTPLSHVATPVVPRASTKLKNATVVKASVFDSRCTKTRALVKKLNPFASSACSGEIVLTFNIILVVFVRRVILCEVVVQTNWRKWVTKGVDDEN